MCKLSTLSLQSDKLSTTRMPPDITAEAKSGKICEPQNKMWSDAVNVETLPHNKQGGRLRDPQG